MPQSDHTATAVNMSVHKAYLQWSVAQRYLR